MSILGGDNLLCVEKDNIYPSQRTNNHFNSTTIVCIWTKTALYDYFFFKKEDEQLHSLTLTKLNFEIRNMIQKTLQNLINL